MTAPDIRAYYAALGIELPGWPKLEAPVRCFAEPDAHNHADRSPSCSVNLASGAWNCHGCGAHGGAYDAALAVGHAPRSAMDLLIAHGLTEPRDGGHGRSGKARVALRTAAPARAPEVPATLRADDLDVKCWGEMLEADGRLLCRLLRERGWSYRAMRYLEVGFDGARITVPIRNGGGHLRGVLRYDPFGLRSPKMRALPGSRLGLIPHPARETSPHIVLVEGPPDMIAARSCSLAAIAVPGTNAWRPDWTSLLAGRSVTIVMDCDEAGRHAAEEIAQSLARAATTVEIIDLSPDRDDGYDLTDRILERRRIKPFSPRGVRTVRELLAPHPANRRHDRRLPVTSDLTGNAAGPVNAWHSQRDGREPLETQ